MFRIHFDPSVSMFVVQLSFYGLWWRTCRDKEGIRQFPTWADACKWVSDIGLADAYKFHEPAKSVARLAHAR